MSEGGYPQVLIGAAIANTNPLAPQSFTVPGSYTWTKPAGLKSTSTVVVTVIGGGGGGAASNGNNTSGAVLSGAGGNGSAGSVVITINL